MSSIRPVVHFKSLFLAIFLFFYETAIFFLYVEYLIPSILFLLLHLISVALVLLLIKRVREKNEDQTFPLLLFISLFGSFPLGIYGFLLQSILIPLFSFFSTPASKWLSELFPTTQKSPFASIYQRVRSGWDDYNRLNEVNSFQDIFHYGTLSQKQSVLDTIVKDFNPIYSPLLMTALNDPANSIRIQAAAIVSKIDYDFDQEIAKLLVLHKEHPDDEKIIFNLADTYDEYATSGILDPLRIKEMARLAIHYYREYLKKMPEDKNALFNIGRLYFLSEDYEPFIEWREEYLKKYKIVPTIVDTWHKEALYKLRRYQDLSFKVRGMI